MKSLNRGFTLIELLVVVSIIGMLASITLVSLQSARDKGRVASAILFSNNMYQGWGADAFGIWKFDEASGADAQDAGPNNFTLTRYNAGHLLNRTTITPLSSGKSADFTSGFTPSEPSMYNTTGVVAKNIKLDKYTASVWLYAPTVLMNGYPFAINNSSGIMIAYINFGSGTLLAGPLCAPPASLTYSSPIGKWVNVTFSWDGTNTKLYLDGKLQTTLVCTTLAVSSWFPASINVGGSLGRQHFNGYVDELAIYPNVLLASQIQQIYAEGLTRHSLAMVDEVRPRPRGLTSW